MNDTAMTRREREDLAALARKREKLAKAATATRTAELLANFEDQLATKFEPEEEMWRSVNAAVNAAVAEANARVAEQMEQLGVPERFRPRVDGGVRWTERGENSTATRRVELRRVATTRLAAMEKDAKTEIERRSLDVQTELLAGGLSSDAARQFLERMPSPQELMPPLAVGDVETVLLAEKAERDQRQSDESARWLQRYGS